MKFLKLGLSAVLITACAWAGATGLEGYGKARWGMSRQEVKGLYPGSLLHEGQLLLPSQTVADHSAALVFEFDEDKLSGVDVIFDDQHVNSNSYVDDYRAIKSLLTKKYGTPSIDKEHWSDDIYRNDYNNRGMAVAAGHLGLLSEWDTSETQIRLMCTGDNFKIQIYLSYHNLKSAPLEQKKREEKTLDSL